MAAKTTVISQAKTKASKARSSSRPADLKNLSSIKSTKASPSLKYPKLSAKTKSGKVTSKVKAKSSSSVRSSIKSFVAAVKKAKKSGALGAASSSTPTKKNSGSPAFFGPIAPDTLL